LRIKLFQGVTKEYTKEYTKELQIDDDDKEISKIRINIFLYLQDSIILNLEVSGKIGTPKN